MHLLHGNINTLPKTQENGHKSLWNGKCTLQNCVYDPINKQKYTFVYEVICVWIFKDLKAIANVNSNYL